MAREPADRYPNAAELADDLLRFQSGRLVAARRYSLVARAWRRIVRYRGTLAIAAVVAVAAIAITVALRDEPPDLGTACIRGADRARAVWDPVMAARAKLDARAAEGLDRYTRDWKDARVAACVATHERGEQSAALLDLRIDCLDRRLTELGALVGVFVDKPGTPRAVDAVSRLTPIATCNDVVALQAVIPPPSDPLSRARVAQLRTTIASAKALTDTNQFASGLASIRGAVAEAETLGYAPVLGEALYRRAKLEDRAGDAKAAEATLRRAVVIAAAAHDDRLAAWIWPDLLFVINTRLSRPDDALQLREAAEASIRRVAADANDQAHLDDVIGDILRMKGRYDEALPYFERGFALREQANGPAHREVAAAASNLSAMLAMRGDFAGAKRYGERAVAIFEKLYGPDHVDVATALHNLGLVLQMSGDLVGARQREERALAIRMKVLGPSHPSVADTLNNLGNIERLDGNFELAASQYRRALDVLERKHGPDHASVATVTMNVATMDLMLGNVDAAKRGFERALAIQERVIGRDHPDTAMTLAGLGDALYAQHDYAGARAVYERAAAIVEKASGADRVMLAFPLTGLAETLLSLGDIAGARAAAERAVALREPTNPEPLQLARSQIVLARALWSSATERRRAIELARRARDTFAAHRRAGERPLAEAESWLRAHVL
jgi:tetratricopeptide (TPR) repeat protein